MHNWGAADRAELIETAELTITAEVAVELLMDEHIFDAGPSVSVVALRSSRSNIVVMPTQL